MLKPFKPICKPIKTYYNNTIANNVIDRYTISKPSSKSIDSTFERSNMVHKTIFNTLNRDSDNSQLILSILNLLQRIGSLSKSTKSRETSIVKLNLNMTLEYCLNMLKYRNYQTYSSLNSLRVKLDSLSNDQELTTYNRDIQSRLELFKQNILKYNDYSKPTIKLNSTNTSFFNMLNNHSFRYLISQNREYSSLMDSMSQRFKSSKYTQLKDSLINAIYNSSQTQTDYIWKTILNNNVLSKEVLSLTDSESMSSKERIALVIDCSSTDNFYALIGVLKQSLQKDSLAKVTRYKEVVKNELSNILSVNYVRSKKQFLEAFNGMTSEDKERVVEVLHLKDSLSEYLSKVSMKEYNQSILSLKSISLNSLTDWYNTIDNFKVNAYYDTVQNRYMQSFFENTLKVDFLNSVNDIFNSKGFNRYLNETEHIQKVSTDTILLNYLKYILTSHKGVDSTILSILDKVNHQTLDTLSNEEIFTLTNVLNSHRDVSKVDSMISSILDKVNRQTLDTLSSEETSTLTNILNSHKSVSKVDNTILSILDKVNRQTLDTLSNEETSTLTNILNSHKSVSKVFSYSAGESA